MMALKAGSSSLARMPAAAGMAVRAMSAQAFMPEFPGVSAPSAGAPDFSEVQSTTLPNGVVVTSQDTGSLASSVSVVIGAGSGKETMATAGMAATLKQIAFCSTEQQTAFKLVREAEEHSASFSSSSSRDSVAYSSTFARGDTQFAATLAECVTAPALHSWEVARYGSFAGRVAATEAEATVADAYAVAFRNTAGRAPFAPAARVGKISPAEVAAYRAANFTGANTTVVGLDIDHSDLVSAVAALGDLPASGAPATAVAYYGGESRTTLFTANTTVAFLVGSSAPIAKLPALVLGNIIGGQGSAIAWSTDATASRVGSAVGKTTAAPFSVRGFTGDNVVGFHATVSSADVANSAAAAVAAAKEVLAGNFSEADVTRAKNQLRAAVLESGREGRLAALAESTTPEALSAAIKSVSVADVKALASTLAKSAPSYAVRGNTDAAPFLGDL